MGKKLAHQQLVNETLANSNSDSEFSRNAKEEYLEHASGLLMELTLAGYYVSVISELRTVKAKDLPIAILVKWLPKISYKPLHSDVVECLASKKALGALIKELERPDMDQWLVGHAISRLLGPNDFEIVWPLLDAKFGDGRKMLVLKMGRMKKTKAMITVLSELLNDGNTALESIKSLGLLLATEARTQIENFLDSEFLNDFWEQHPDMRGLRKDSLSSLKMEAKKAIKRIDNVAR